MRINQGLDRPSRTTLRNIPSNFLWIAMASAVAFWAVPSSHFPTTSTTSNFLPDLSRTSLKPLCRSRSTELPDGPRYLEQLARVRFDLLQEPASSEAAEFDLVNVDCDRIRRLDNVIE